MGEKPPRRLVEKSGLGNRRFMSFLSQLLQDVKEAIQHTARGETLVSNPDLTRFQRMVQRYVRVFFLVARWDVLKQLKLHAQALTSKTHLPTVLHLEFISSTR